jgi:outer membrane protein OmpA-like peptidoglycan-associated protein
MLNIAYAYQYHVGDNYNAFSPGGTSEIQLAIRLCKKDKAMIKEEVKPVVDPNADKVGVSVNMSDEKYGNPVMGDITIMKGKTVVYSGKGDASGISNFYLAPGVYKMSSGAKGYIPVEETIDISKNEKGSKYEVKLKQPKIEKGLVFKLKAINFETGADKMKESSFDILNKMAAILNENPNMVIEVAGHTDNVGDDQKNLVLSENRAKTVMNYLISKGVKASQMKAVGYGETQPIADNNTEEGRLANRRVMFTVLEF